MAWGVLAWCLACSSTNKPGAGAASSSPCSPLDATTSSVKLDATSILAAGRSTDDTVYVLTETASELRLFVTDGDGLAEQFEVGTGEASEGALTTWTFDYSAADGSPVSVEAERDDSGLRMGVLKGPKDGKAWQIGAQGETLTLVPATDAAKLSAISVQSFYLDYEATRDDGNAIVIVAPAHAGSFDAFRLFWGPPSALSEEKITSFSRSLSNSTSLTFSLGAEMATLNYAVPSIGPDGGVTDSSEGSLTLDGQTSVLSGAWPPVLPDGAQFLCR